MSALHTLKRMLRRLTIKELIARELGEAEMELLEAQSAVEYSASVVTYNAARIARLKKLLAQGERHA